jgi:hypothetical protein
VSICSLTQVLSLLLILLLPTFLGNSAFGHRTLDPVSLDHFYTSLANHKSDINGGEPRSLASEGKELGSIFVAHHCVRPMMTDPFPASPWRRLILRDLVGKTEEESWLQPYTYTMV